MFDNVCAIWTWLFLITDRDLSHQFSPRPRISETEYFVEFNAPNDVLLFVGPYAHNLHSLQETFYFCFPSVDANTRICMVQYRTFLSGQLCESILGPIGSHKHRPYRTPDTHRRVSDIVVTGLPLFHDTLRMHTLTLRCSICCCDLCCGHGETVEVQSGKINTAQGNEGNAYGGNH